MAATKDTTYQNYYDGFGKGLPLGIRDYDSTGRVMLVLSAVADSSPVAGTTYFTPGTGVLSIHNGTKFLNVTLS